MPKTQIVAELTLSADKKSFFVQSCCVLLFPEIQLEEMNSTNNSGRKIELTTGEFHLAHTDA